MILSSNLIVLAHRGEASQIIKSFEAKAHDASGFYGLNNGDYLLITGEGLNDAIARLSYVLGQIQGIAHVFNFGICGNIRGEVTENSFEVRTVYAENQFKSFTLNSHAIFDIITSTKRVLSQEYAETLSAFAPFVDRELWGYAYACQLFHKPLRSFKVVSDSPFNHKGEQNICERVKENSPFFSEQILALYQQINKSKEERSQHQNHHKNHHENHKDISLERISEALNIPLHLSVSQSYELKKIIVKLAARNSASTTQQDVLAIITKDKIEEIKNMNLRPKENGRLIINELKNALNPFTSKATGKLEALNRMQQKKGFDITHDAHFESKKIKISFYLEKEEDKKIMSSLVEQFPLDKYHAIFDGKENV